MTQPVFRYIVVLLGAIVLVRIIIDISTAWKHNEEKKQAASLTEKQVGDATPSEIEHLEDDVEQLMEQPDQASKNHE
ncbi:MAG: hypothetical protein AAGU15_10440 [Anaerolineaceae bacterium]|jgi:hypothetical protein